MAEEWYPAERLPYVVPNEITVDNALGKGDFSRARRFADEIIERHSKEPGPTLSSELFHVLAKKNALPLYERVYGYFYGKRDVFSGELAKEVEAVHSTTVDLLEKLRLILDETEPTYEDGERYVGYAGELTVMALICRGNSGNASDRYDILPTSQQSDRGDKPGRDGVRNGVDFILIDYETGNDKHLQIKTTAAHYRYADGITVISTTTIAGGTRRDVRELQSALIAECNGTATDEQIQHIELATGRLEAAIHA